MVTHFQNDLVTISFDPDLRLGIAVWDGFLSSSELREAIGVCLDLMDEQKLLRWLGDNRKLRAIRQTDQDWFVEVALPRMFASTLQRNASVLSEDLFNRMAMEQIVKRADNQSDIVFCDFGSYEDAFDWLTRPLAVH